MTLLGEIQKLIEEHGSSSILRERLSSWQEKLDALEKDKKALQTKLANSEKEVAELRTQLATKKAAEEFVEHRGAFFKRRPGGGYHQAVYCPRCRNPMGSLEKIAPYSCNACLIMLDFNGNALPRIMEELP